MSLVEREAEVARVAEMVLPATTARSERYAVALAFEVATRFVDARETRKERAARLYEASVLS